MSPAQKKALLYCRMYGVVLENEVAPNTVRALLARGWIAAAPAKFIGGNGAGWAKRYTITEDGHAALSKVGRTT